MTSFSLSEMLWIATACYVWHVLEGSQLGWPNWARAVLKLPVEWSDFYLVNGLVIAFGMCAANLASQPMLALSFPALMLLSATFFYVAPFLVTRRYPPGLVTALLLFYPVGIVCYLRADLEGGLTVTDIAVSFSIGALMIVTPLILLYLKHQPYFRQYC